LCFSFEILALLPFWPFIPNLPLILLLFSSKLIFPRLPHANPGKPNTKHSFHSLCIRYFPVDTTLSSALTALPGLPSLCLLSLLLGPLFGSCGLKKYSSY